MRRFLLFQLWGPLASWGDIAIGDIRPSHSAPTKSALMGLIAACMGIPRTAEDKLLALNSALSYGVRVDAPGSVMQDYHTTQTPGNKKFRDLSTRREEIMTASEADDVQTILSRREYRCDAAYTVGIWGDADLLKEVFEALKRPVFTPFLGRKSCPLALPLAPVLEESSSLRDAFNTYEHQRKPVRSQTRYVWEGAEAQGFDSPARIERHERLISRGRWQFGALILNEVYEAERTS